MKVTKEHYETIKEAIKNTFPMAEIEKHREYITTEGKAKDVSKRLRWDCLYYARMKDLHWKDLYTYCNDSHIDTALKAIMRDLNII